MAMPQFNAEEVAFAHIAAGPFATFGFELTKKLIKRKIDKREWCHQILIWCYNQFEGNPDIVWRFVDYALPSHDVLLLQRYAREVSKQLEKEKMV